MRVLLLSHNHTVQEMVALALRELTDVELVTAQAADHLEPTTYHMVLIDDALPFYEESGALVQALGVEPIVLLAHRGTPDAERFDRVIYKPFLPAEIRELVAKERERIAIDTSRSSQKKKPKKVKKKKRTEVLDPDEIATIKSLLEEEGLEVISEEELTDTVLQEREDPDGQDAVEWARLLKKMKTKKLRRLLRGATVRIEITFPKDAK
jgi:hypothetical protein